jgi:8-oxo-dGTP diphosphatase
MDGGGREGGKLANIIQPSKFRLERKKWKTIKTGGHLMQAMAQISVRPSVMVFKDGKMLVVKSVYDGEEFYVLPGGGVEGFETLPECAVRETLEETSQRIRIVRLAYVNDYIVPGKGRCLNVFFIGDLVGDDKLTHLNDPDLHKKVVKSAEWRSLAELKKLDFRPQELIDRAIKDGLLEGKAKKGSGTADFYFRTS